MMRRRLLKTAVEDLSTGGIPRRARQLENESRAASWPLAFSTQRSTQFLGRQRATVQTEAMPGLTRREAVIENATHILWEDAHPIVNDGDAHAVRCTLDAQGHELIGSARLVACV